MSEAYFTNIRNNIIENIKDSNKSLKIAVAWFTDKKLLKVVEKLLDEKRDIEIIVFNDRINKKELYENLYYKGAKIFLSQKLMHNKFCVIDEHTVINGSYNWTFNASTNNENIQITRHHYELANNFLKEFESLKTKSKPIDNFFLYSIQQLKYIESEFEDYFEIHKDQQYPYFYFIDDLKISEKNKFSKFKEGIYLIKNVQEERELYWRKYFLESNYSIGKINKLLNIKTSLPERFDEVNSVVFNSNSKCILKESKYLVETHNNYKYVFFINNEGEVIGEKIQFTEKLPNGIYLQNFSNWGSKKYIVDINLKKFPLNIINLTVHKKIGIFGEKTTTKNDNLFFKGLLSFVGKTLIPFHYDEYSIDEKNYRIEFREYPISKFKPEEKKLVSISKKYDLLELPYKKYIYDFNGRLLNEKELIEKEKKLTDSHFLFLSEDNRRYAELYIAASDLIGTKYPLLQEYGISADRLTRMKKSILQNNMSEDMVLEVQEKVLEIEDTNHKYYKTGKYAKKDSCYIATMVYKSYDHPDVKVLRSFRDNTLMKFPLGRYFITFYYKYSPKLVLIVQDKYILKRFFKKAVDLVVIVIKNVA